MLLLLTQRQYCNLFQQPGSSAPQKTYWYHNYRRRNRALHWYYKQGIGNARVHESSAHDDRKINM